MYQQSERPVFNARQVISPIHYDVINKKLNNIVFCLDPPFISTGQQNAENVKKSLNS